MSVGGTTQELLYSVHPTAVEIRVIADEWRRFCHALNLPGEALVKSCQPTRHFEPHGKISDLIQLRAVHPFEEQPVPLVPQIDHTGVELRGPKPVQLGELSINLDLTSRVVDKVRFR